jgi:hypothetical protein
MSVTLPYIVIIIFACLLWVCLFVYDFATMVEGWPSPLVCPDLVSLRVSPGYKWRKLQIHALLFPICDML